MRTRILFLVMVSLVLLGLAQDGFAVELWDDGDPSGHSWCVGANWNHDLVPDSTLDASIKLNGPGPVIESPCAAECKTLRLEPQSSFATPSELTINSGSLTNYGAFLIGAAGNSVGTLNINGGTVQVSDQCWVGNQGVATLNMNGGELNVPTNLWISRGTNVAAGEGHAYLNGGTIYYNGFTMGNNGRPATMDVAGGVLMINGDWTTKVVGYVTSGWITGYGGDGTVQVDYDVTNPSQTTVRGVHYLKPNPIDGGEAASGMVELSWTLPDPCVAGEPVSVDVYFTDNWEALYSFTDPGAIRVVSGQNVTSVAVQTLPKVGTCLARYFSF